MALFPELERILLDDAIPFRMREDSSEEDLSKQGKIRILDITLPFDEIVSQITREDMLFTNYVVLLQNPKNNRWIALSTRKPHYIPGYSSCQIDVVRYAGKGEKVFGGDEECGGIIPTEPWNGDEQTPGFPSPESLARVLYEEAKSRVSRGYTLTYPSAENARANTPILFSDTGFPKKKLKDDPVFQRAVEDLTTYLHNVKSDFEKMDVHTICIEYTICDWQYRRAHNPWKSVVREAVRRLSFVHSYYDIDPHGSGDGGTLVFEVAPLNGRRTAELYSVGMDAKPTGELDEKKFESDVSVIELDCISHFIP